MSAHLPQCICSECKPTFLGTVSSKISCQDKLVRYLARHPSGLSQGQMRAWVESCRKHGGYTWQEFESALYALRNAGRCVCTNGNWWIKDLPTTMKEAANERSNRRNQKCGNRVSSSIGVLDGSSQSELGESEE